MRALLRVVHGLVYAFGMFGFRTVLGDTILLMDGRSIADVQITSQSTGFVEYVGTPGQRPQSLSKKLIRRMTYQEVDWKAKELAQMRERMLAARRRLEALHRGGADDPESVLRQQAERLKAYDFPERSRLAALRTRGLEWEQKGRRLDATLAKPGTSSADRATLRRERARVATEIAAFHKENARLRRRLGEELVGASDDLDHIRSEIDRAIGLLQKQRSAAKEGNAVGRLEGDLLLAEKDHAQALKEKAYRGSIWRSLVLPGWGQALRDDTMRGRLFMGAFSGAILYALQARNASREARAAFQDPGPAFLSLSSPNAVIPGAFYYADRGTQYRARNQRFNHAFLLLPAIWVAGLVDTAFFLDARREGRDGPKSATGARDRGEFGVTLRIGAVDWARSSAWESK